MNTPHNRLMAALRDASWLRNPDTRSPKRWHVLKVDGRPACGLVAEMCDEDAIPAEQVPQELRCKKAGCDRHWPNPQPEVPRT
jgi:hypothetical protein